MKLFGKIKDKLAGSNERAMLREHDEEEYVELDTDSHEQRPKVVVRPFILSDFEDMKGILDALRQGNTIGLINIRPLKDKDIVELKRAINKLKKTTDAMDGQIAGFGEDYIIFTPGFAEIFKSKVAAPIKADDIDDSLEKEDTY